MGNVIENINTPENPEYVFYCPGCKCSHSVTINHKNEVGASWSFSGTLENPTFAPSVLIKVNEKTLCHLFVREGFIEFLNDCSHALRGKKVKMEPL